MDPIEKRELKRQAWMRLAAQRRRAGLLRGRVVVVSLICFVVLWGVVFAQMATGNDPVLSGEEKAVATRTRRRSRRDGRIETTEPREVEPDAAARKKKSSHGGRRSRSEPEVEECRNRTGIRRRTAGDEPVMTERRSRASSASAGAARSGSPAPSGAAKRPRPPRDARRVLLDAHRILSRFDPESELSRLNRDPAARCPPRR